MVVVTAFILLTNIISHISSAQRQYVLEVLSSSKTWSQSNSLCEQRYGTELATIISQEDRASLVSYAQSAGQYLWIGLTDQESEGNWKWIDGTPCTIANGDCSEFWTYTLDNIGDVTGASNADCGFWDTILDTLGEANCVSTAIFDGGYLCNANACNIVIDGASECTITSNCASNQRCNDRSNTGTLISLTGSAQCPTYCTCYCLDIPTTEPTSNPTSNPTYTPTPSPTNIPTNVPTNYPSNIPSNVPTNNPTKAQTASDQEGHVQNSISANIRHLTTKSPKQIQTNSDTLRLLFIIFIIFAAVIVVGCILFFIYRNKGKSMSVAKERHIGIELNSMSTPRDDNVMLTPTAGAVMKNDDDIVANIMAKNDDIVLAVSGEDIDNMAGKTTSGDVDQNDEEKEVTFMAMLSVARIQCAQELMVSAIEERYQIELEEEGDMDDSVDDVKGEYLQEGKNVYGLRENKTTNDGSKCTTTGAANDVNNQNEK